MADRHKEPPIPVRPPSQQRSWLLAYAQRTGQAVNAVVVKALTEYRERHDTA